MAKQDDGGQISKIDIEDEEIHWDTDLDYAQYLQLDRVLTSQLPLTGEHDEILFIVIHQATELWLKVCLHELRGAIACLQRDRLRPAFKMLARMARIQEQLKQSWDILSTLTPFDISNSATIWDAPRVSSRFSTGCWNLPSAPRMPA